MTSWHWLEVYLVLVWCITVLSKLLVLRLVVCTYLQGHFFKSLMIDCPWDVSFATISHQLQIETQQPIQLRARNELPPKVDLVSHTCYSVHWRYSLAAN